MKNVFLFSAIVALFAFNAVSRPENLSAANVEQVQGIYIFTDSKPVASYKYIETIKSKSVQPGTDPLGKPIGNCFCDLSYTGLRDDFIRQAKKKYKTANAMIINAAEGKADLIILNE